jgi:hypothetical protein
MPTRKQMEQMAAALERKASSGPAPDDELPSEYWQAILEDPCVQAKSSGSPVSRRSQRLSQIPQHVLRVSCRRCGRIVEIQKADADRLYGREAIWRDVGQRLLDNTCTQKTGRHEEDGCWPSFDGT